MAGTITTLVATFAIAVIGQNLARRRPKQNLSKDGARQRLSKFMLFAGILIALGGLLLLGTAMTRPEVDDFVPMLIASLGLLIGGAFFIIFYALYFVAISSTGIATRGLLGQSKAIRYDQLISYRLEPGVDENQILKLQGADGTKININVTKFYAEPLLEYLANREQRETVWGTATAVSPTRNTRPENTVPDSSRQDQQPPRSPSAESSAPWGSGTSAWGDDDGSNAHNGPFYQGR
ncbi:MAG: hypothetical protein ACTH1Z_07410 [Ancrocorticia sp.]|uniref:hypothetical protein n=1 Tax=Ancrocorticia sp. TaxID=2593684 RepID=UPI003F8DF109